ncbi:MAG: hypothetical protein HY505_01525 [Candidatus Yanofskybacteria bacterium]|nr:hypothetical protein [Candidatus Yanofskybacteria bacterium]
MSQKKDSERLGFEIQYTLAHVEIQVLGILQELVGKTFGIQELYGTRRIQRLSGPSWNVPRVYRGMFCIRGLEKINVHFCLREEARQGYLGAYPHNDTVELYPVEIIARTSVVVFIGSETVVIKNKPEIFEDFKDCVFYFEKRPWESDFEEKDLPKDRWTESAIWGNRVPPDLLCTPPRSVIYR